MDEQRTIRIDLEALGRLANTFINRGVVFMGLGTNAALVRPPLRHDISYPGIMTFQLVRTAADDDAALTYVEEFERWIIANSLRELVEGFSFFLARAYRDTWTVFRVVGAADQNPMMLPKNFAHRGADEQLSRLGNVLGAKFATADMFETWTVFRNCLAHRMGLVHRDDVNGEHDGMVLRWRAPRIFVVGDDGAETDIGGDDVPTDGVYIEKGGRVAVQYVARERSFAVGETARLTQRQLTEIFMGAGETAKEVVAAMESRFRALGLDVEVKASNPPAAPAR